MEYKTAIKKNKVDLSVCTDMEKSSRYTDKVCTLKKGTLSKNNKEGY